MADREHLIILAYDVPDARERRILAEFLEKRMTRVQGSVFEGWMTRAHAEKLGRDAAIIVGPTASLRLYVVPRGGVAACQAWGFPPAPCPDGALIL
jgi:CRISPR-associated endonuclease Cas2